MINTAVILATDFNPLSSKLKQDRPHAMLPAVGKPLIVRVMTPLYQAGIRNFIVIVGVNDGSIAAYLKNHWLPDITVSYEILPHRTQFYSLLQQINSRLEPPYLYTEYNRYAHQSAVPRLIQATQNHPHPGLYLTAPQSTLTQSHHRLYFHSQARTITDEPANDTTLLTYPLIIGHSFQQFMVEQFIPDEQFQMRSILRQYLSTQPEQALFVPTVWSMTIETDQDLLSMTQQLFQETNDNHILSELPISVKITHPVRIDPRVSVGQNAHIGPNVYLEKGCRIGTGVQISNSIVLSKGVIPANEKVTNQVISRQQSNSD